jgi:histidine ammonia-lyase
MVNVENGQLSDEVLKLSETFNIGLIHAHTAGVAPEMPTTVVRAIMTTRLNSILYGATGAQPRVAELYRDFLNHHITPILPSRGSVGQADITLITHIGLAMIGEGDVYYQGQRMKAADALSLAGLEPLKPVGKDALAILSSNAYSEALAALSLVEAKHLATVSKLVLALSLEALNGNIEPFLRDAQQVRPFPYVNKAAETLRTILEGSYLWDQSKSRALQYPLSYRTGAYILGSLDRALAEAQEMLRIQLNSSDDNPGIILDVVAPSKHYEEESHYAANHELSGAVIPTANFSPLPWVISFERLGIALSHMSSASVQRINKLGDSHFTHLSRFLGTDKTVHAYGAIQKVFISLSAENRELANPVSLDYFAIAGNIEDVATNAPRVMRRVHKMVDNLYYILGMEMMHAAQAIDLRLKQSPDLKLATKTFAFFKAFRKQVSFMEVDRTLTYDIEQAYLFLKNYPLN